jgi:hypothetical protein
MPGSKHKKGALESKICPVCRRPFSNRKKWSSRGIWDSIKYCSERCRRAASA